MEDSVAGTVGSAESHAEDALAASLVASGARVDALAAQAVTLSYRDAALSARDLASGYASTAGSHAANALVYKNQAEAAASSATSSETAVIAAAIEVEADRVAADAARVAAQTAAAAAATFDPSSFYTKTAADARYRQLSTPITWTELTGKPSSFTPTSHTHAWADITSGKPTTLAGYGITDPVWTSANFTPATKLDRRFELDPYAATITDWNNAVTNGWFMAAGAANAPAGAGSNWLMGRVTVHNNDWIQQEVWDFTAGANVIRYRRHKTGGTWGAWTTDVTFGNVSGRDITASRGDGTGVIFLNAAQNKYLFWDATKYIMPGGSLSVGGSVLADADVRGVYLYPTNANGAHLSGNYGGIQANGQFYTTAGHQQLWADSAGWVRAPRIFVGGADPGAKASDGDIWIP
jgi:hypothetical protein